MDETGNKNSENSFGNGNDIETSNGNLSDVTISPKFYEQVDEFGQSPPPEDTSKVEKAIKVWKYLAEFLRVNGITQLPPQLETVADDLIRSMDKNEIEQSSTTKYKENESTANVQRRTHIRYTPMECHSVNYYMPPMVVASTPTDSASQVHNNQHHGMQNNTVSVSVVENSVKEKEHNSTLIVAPRNMSNLRNIKNFNNYINRINSTKRKQGCQEMLIRKNVRTYGPSKQKITLGNNSKNLLLQKKISENASKNAVILLRKGSIAESMLGEKKCQVIIPSQRRRNPNKTGYLKKNRNCLIRVRTVEEINSLSASKFSTEVINNNCSKVTKNKESDKIDEQKQEDHADSEH